MPQSAAQAMTAESLDRACNTPTGDSSYELNFALCVGYIHGVIDHERLRSRDVAANGIFCIRDEVSNAELRGLVRRYLTTRSERRSEMAAMMVSEALADAFPCRKAG